MRFLLSDSDPRRFFERRKAKAPPKKQPKAKAVTQKQLKAQMKAQQLAMAAAERAQRKVERAAALEAQRRFKEQQREALKREDKAQREAARAEKKETQKKQRETRKAEDKKDKEDRHAAYFSLPWARAVPPRGMNPVLFVMLPDSLYVLLERFFKALLTDAVDALTGQPIYRYVSHEGGKTMKPEDFRFRGFQVNISAGDGGPLRRVGLVQETIMGALMAIAAILDSAADTRELYVLGHVDRRERRCGGSTMGF